MCNLHFFQYRLVLLICHVLLQTYSTKMYKVARSGIEGDTRGKNVLYVIACAVLLSETGSV